MNRSRPTRRLSLVLAASASLVLALVSPADAATGKITGTVTTETTGASLPETFVSLYRYEDGSWNYLDDRQTSSNGGYSFSSLAAGQYAVSFSTAFAYDDEGNQTGVYAGEYWNDKPSLETATRITVGSGTSATASASLAPAATVAGHVTLVGQSDASAAEVSVLQREVRDGEVEWNEVQNGYADESGDYEVGGLAAGTYRVRFGTEPGTHLTEYYDDKSTVAAAKDVVLAKGARVGGIDATLAKAGQITGSVTSTSGKALSGADVLVETYDAEQDDWTIVDSTSVGDDGSYVVGDLRTGSYRVQFDSESYLSEYYDDAYDPDDATPVQVTTGDVRSGVDATLVRAGSVTGKVTLPGGAAAKNVRVVAWQKKGGSWEEADSAETSRTGTYTIESLVPGPYAIQFDPEDTAYANETYSNKTSLAAADPVTVVGGVTTKGINAELGRSGTISGTVKLPRGVTDQNARSVRAVRVDASEEMYERTREVVARKSTSGYSYSIKGLTPGSYRVEFARASGQSLAVGQYYKGKDEKLGTASASAVKVGAGRTTASINDVVDKKAGSITGTLLSADGKPIRCYVMASSTDDSSPTFTTRSTRTAYSSATTGRFTIGGLSDGDYRITLVSGYTGDKDACRVAGTSDNPNGYEQYYYDDAAGSQSHTTNDKDDADTVHVTTATSTTLPHVLHYGPSKGSTFTSAPDPKVGGKAAVGSTLTSSAAAPTPAPDAVTRQWFRGTSPIKGATNASYTVVPADAGTAITVRYTYAKAGYVQRPVFSAAVRIGAKNVKKPTIKGTAAVGRTVSASTGTWAGSGWTFAYQWYRGSTAIRGATGSRLRLTAASRGKKLSVKVTAKKTGHASASATSPSRKVS